MYSLGISFVPIQNNRKLKNLAKRWEPRLTRKPKKRDTVLKLFTASDDHTALLGFVTETDQAIKDFLVRSGAHNRQKTNAHYFVKVTFRS